MLYDATFTIMNSNRFQKTFKGEPSYVPNGPTYQVDLK